MATTKGATVVHNDITLTAGAADTVSSVIDFIDGYGGEGYIRVTNGATGPTLPAQVQVEAGPANDDIYDYGGPHKAALGNDAISEWPFVIPIGRKYLRFTSGSNTGQDVVLRVVVTEVTAV